MTARIQKQSAAAALAFYCTGDDEFFPRLRLKRGSRNIALHSVFLKGWGSPFKNGTGVSPIRRGCGNINNSN